MTIEAYINPDFTWREKLLFFAMALLGILLCNLLLFGWTRIRRAVSGEGDEGPEAYRDRLFRFYELIISAASVITFACAYVVMNHVYTLYEGTTDSGLMGFFLNMWGNWKDFVLLLMICLSCLINTLLDRVFIPLKVLARERIAVVRMQGMFYAIIVLLYLNVIGDESEYHPVVIYYLGLMIGRFVYFDASFRDFLRAMKNMFFSTPMFVLALSLSGLLSFIGFKAGYLLERNYYIVGIFYTHLFLLAAVFLLYHIQGLIIRCLTSRKPPEPEVYYYEETCYEPQEEERQD
ncbi:MAG: hypothetical protein IK115_12415 [Lachnospiraceae bacterium]|nr:hypothetical protein [Lachnospiraceae bacterium]